MYIGQSRNIEKRFKNYRQYDCKKQIRLYRSLVKHGVENHIFEIVAECGVSDLDFFEQYYIYEYGTFNTEMGLNLRDGGKSYKCSDEMKQRMSASQKSKKLSPEMKQKLLLANLGRIRPQHERDKISASHKGKVRSAEHQANQVIALKQSPIVQAKMKKMQELCKKKVINEKTGIIYPSATEAAKKEGFLKSSLTNMLNGFRKNRTSLKYVN